ncbi:hypothetical protein Tco_0486628 [Tanacetum coccineum]
MQEQSAPGDTNDYELSKMLRVQENQERLRQLGVKNIAKSFTSLVEGDKTKKRKKKTVANDKSIECYPDSCRDGEENDYEVATRAKLLQKQHRTQYIAPMAMNRYANLTKERVSASNAPHMNNVDIEHDGAQNDDEDTDHVISENIENEIEGDDAGFQDLNEYGREQHGLVDDEIEDTEHIMFGNNQNKIELGSDSEDEYENEIVERVKEQTEALTYKRKQERDTVGQFSQFLGTIARNAYAPLTYSSWPKVPDKEMMWKYVLKRCLAAMDLRLSQKNMHTAGLKSFARICEEMEKMRNYNPLENDSAPADPFLAKVNGDGSASMATREIVKSPTVSLEVEKGQSVDMQRDLEANFERRISELKEDHERKLEAMQKNDDNRENLIEDAVQKILGKIPLEETYTRLSQLRFVLELLEYHLIVTVEGVRTLKNVFP